MPRQKSDENLKKVVSTNLSEDNYKMLEKYAKVFYNVNQLKQPTISHVVRFILNSWVIQMRKIEQQTISKHSLNQPAENKLSTIKTRRHEEKWMEYSTDGY